MTGILRVPTATGLLPVSLRVHPWSRCLRAIAVWNKELLFVGGFLARVAYESEMQDASQWWTTLVTSKNPGEPLDKKLQEWFYSKAVHIMQFFTFHPSTPSAVVSADMQSAFFNCATSERPFCIISTKGIKPAVDVRMSDDASTPLLEELPVFPRKLYERSKSMVKALRERGMLRDATFREVLGDIRRRSLSEMEVVSCLKWWISISGKNPAGVASMRREFLDAVVLTISSSENGDKRTIPLKEIQTFMNPQTVDGPMDGPLPSHLLPTNISQKFSSSHLEQHLQWRKFTILDWTKGVVDPAARTNFNIVECSDWAEHVLRTLGMQWEIMATSTRTSVVGLLSNLRCIPTSAGMKVPKQTYFATTDHFPDLPVVNLPSVPKIKNNLRELLVELGVREHVDIQTVYEQ